MTTAQQLLATSARFHGQRYRFGAEIGGTTLSAALAQVRARGTDCSEHVETVCRLHGVRIPDGAFYQWKHCKRITVAEGLRTPGALLFIGDGRGVGRNAITHVAFSRGDGTTSEARSARYGVGSFSVQNRGWSFAGLIPGVDHGAKAKPATPAQLAGEVDLHAIARALDDAQRHTLRLGSHGDPVKWCQALVNNRVQGLALAVDGAFGDATDAGVRWFQWHVQQMFFRAEPHRFRVDGVVGPATWAFLRGA